MAERDTGERLPRRTPEEASGSLLEYLADAEPGSAKMLALSDRLAWDELEEHHDEHISRLKKLTAENDRGAILYEESRLRITEMETALLRRDMRIREATIKGYGAAYSRISDDIWHVEQDDEEKIYQSMMGVLRRRILAGLEK